MAKLMKMSPGPVGRRRAASFLLASALATFPWQSFAAECKVSSTVSPDVEILRIKANRLAELRPIARDEALVIGEAVRGGEALVSIPESRPVQRDVDVNPSPSPGALTPRIITYTDGGKVYRAMVWGGFSESDAIEGDKRHRAYEAKIGPETNPLILAVNQGDAKAVEKLIAEGFDVRTVYDRFGKRTRRPTGIVALAVSRWYGQIFEKKDFLRQAREADDFLKITTMLVEAGADVSLGGGVHNRTALLHVATGNGKYQDPAAALALAKLLLEHGASLNISKNGEREAPLDVVAGRGRPALFEVMLHHGKPTQYDKNSALVAAINSGQFEVALLALEAGAAPDASPAAYGQGSSKPIIANLLPSTKVPRTLLKAMIRHKVNPNIVVRDENTPLMAVIHDHELMKDFLDLGADPNVARRNIGPGSPDGRTALHLATAYEPNPSPGYPLNVYSPKIRARSVELLLRYGANPNIPNGAGVTPLMQTTADDGPAIALLLAAGATINTEAGYSGELKKKGFAVGPVTWALLDGNDTLASALLKRGGKLDAADCGAIFYAARNGATKALTALLDRKEDAHRAAGEDGVTPLMVAAAYGQLSTVNILLDRGAAKVDESTPFSIKMVGGHGPPVPVTIGGNTALMAAAQGNHRAVAAELLKRGADIDLKDFTGRKAIDYARYKGAAEVVILLKAAGARD